MKSIMKGAAKRRTLSLRYGAADHARMASNPAMADIPAPALLPTSELRRLVAAMVD